MKLTWDDPEDIAEQLLKSERARIPTSLQFVADRLYEEGRADLAERIEGIQFELGRANPRVEYVGLLLGPATAEHIVKTYTPAQAPRHLAMISLAVADPELCITNCFHGL